MSLFFTLFNIILWSFVVFAIIRCSMSCQKSCDNSATQTTDQTTIQNQETGNPETSQQPTSASCDGIDPAVLRAKVIQSIFPGQMVDNNSKLVYDPESNSYQWTNDKTSDASCAICIESYVSGDVTVSSQCGHVFHRECIMGWLLHHDNIGGRGRGSVNNKEQGNDECPHCRQLMWDAETYQLVETELRAIWNHSES
ncbi:hypothetical protein MHU86_13502 [Fragilaria crotonensis]|nr:hypothetical protein MHU86_13502 [Fragilaria crotonensis]